MVGEGSAIHLAIPTAISSNAALGLARVGESAWSYLSFTSGLGGRDLPTEG